MGEKQEGSHGCQRRADRASLKRKEEHRTRLWLITRASTGECWSRREAERREEMGEMKAGILVAHQQECSVHEIAHSCLGVVVGDNSICQCVCVIKYRKPPRGTVPYFGEESHEM